VPISQDIKTNPVSRVLVPTALAAVEEEIVEEVTEEVIEVTGVVQVAGVVALDSIRIYHRRSII
jgi:hypothetical protein